MANIIGFFEWLGRRDGALPPLPGEHPIPSGHVRLYHQTDPSNVDSILAHGLGKSHSKGANFDEPSVIWAGREPFYGGVYGDGVATVEFSVPKIQFDAPDKLRVDTVPPESIIAVHLNWHGIARQLIRDYPDGADYVRGFADIDNDHRMAVDAYLRHMGRA